MTDVLYAAQSQGGGGYSLFIMLALLFAAMYFLMIRPQQKRRRQIEQMQSSIGPGDEIVTMGGLYGVVREIGQDTVRLEVAPDVTIRLARGAIGQVVSSRPKPDEAGPSLDKVIDTD